VKRRTTRPAELVCLTVVALAVAIGLVGCGGGSSTSPQHTKTDAAASCPVAPGIASGEKLVAPFSGAKYQIASGIVIAYREWIAGNAQGTGAPTKPLCPQQRQAVADVLLRWATANSAIIAKDSSLKDGGANPVRYLEGQGIRCGDECGIDPGEGTPAGHASGAARAAQLARDTNAQRCAATIAALAKLTDDDAAIVNAPTVAGKATLKADVTNLTETLDAIAGQAPSLKGEAELLYGLAGGDPEQIMLTMSGPPLKQLPGLLHRACS
jgi:hypothetical protein